MNVRRTIKNTAIGVGVLTGTVLLSTQDALVERMHPRYIAGSVKSVTQIGHDFQGGPKYQEYLIEVGCVDGQGRTLYTRDSSIGEKLRSDIYQNSWGEHVRMRLGFFQSESDQRLNIASLDQIEYPSQEEWNALVASGKYKK